MSQNNTGGNTNPVEELFNFFAKISSNVETPKNPVVDLNNDSQTTFDVFDDLIAEGLLGMFPELKHPYATEPNAWKADAEAAKTEKVKREREACMKNHPAGKRVGEKGTVRVTVEDVPPVVTRDARGTMHITVNDPVVKFHQPEDSRSTLEDANDATGEFILAALANLLNSVSTEEPQKEAAILPLLGEVLGRDDSQFDFPENLGLMIEDRNKSVFMFDESDVDGEGHVSFAWFAWGDTKPSYPAFPARVIRTP